MSQQLPVFRFECHPIANAREHQFELGKRERLGQQVVGAGTHRLYGNVDRRVAGDDHDITGRVGGAGGLEYGKTVRMGHVQIGDHNREGRGRPLQRDERRAAVMRQGHRKAKTGAELAEQFPGIAIVIDNQQLDLGHPEVNRHIPAKFEWGTTEKRCEPLTMSRLPCSALIVEDDIDLCSMLAESLEAAGFAAARSGDAADAISRLDGFAYDALVVDLSLPDGDGMGVLQHALSRYPTMTAVVITGGGGVEEAVTAVRLGAVDFLIKPFQLSQVARSLTAGIEQRRLRQENAELRVQLRDRFRFDSIIGCHGSMREIFSTLELVAPMKSTVLIEGETGTGKELIARTIHQNSPRANGRFVAFNAAAIPEGIAEAELFGHVKGAFTGAVASRVGRFELAHNGTLFIDEVASMPLSLQSKLLRVLQEREMERVGESRPVPLDIRVIAASNTDLKKMVKAGEFREDLHYRLNVVPIKLPALRHRRDDIPLLAQHFIKQSCESNGLAIKSLSQGAIRALMAYDWPGNIRQLENAIEHAVAMSARRDEIALETLPADLRTPGESMSTTTEVSIPEEGLCFTTVVSQLERDLILRCLERTGGNKRQAARLLQLSRTTFIDKMQRLNIGSAA